MVMIDSEDDTKQECWLNKVLVWEAKKNGAKVESMSGFTADPVNEDNTTIEGVEANSLIQQVHLWIFWPADVYASLFGRNAESLVEGTDKSGLMCKGALRKASDDDFEVPRRVAAIMKEQRRSVQKRNIFDRSEDHIFEGQGEVAWAQAQKEMKMNVEHDEKNDCEVLLQDSDPNDDFFSPMVIKSKLNANQEGRFFIIASCTDDC